ncbi:MAG: hypothetical protein HKP30_10305 [Myxococcales bacterium]|nr:hypothetical protein [Myxococcales bacterium]
MTRLARSIRFTAVAAAGLALAGITLPQLAAASSIVIQPHLEGGRGRTPNNETEYKVRDSDGNLVARGWITHRDGDNTATVDGLPEGDYTVETYSDRDDGSRIGGRATVNLRDGEQQGQQVEMDPLTPEEDLQEEIEDLEDRIEDLEENVEHIEEDIEEHRRRDEDDAIEDHEEEIERIKDNIKRKNKALRKKRAELAKLRRAGKKAGGKAGVPPGKAGPTLEMPGSAPHMPDLPPVPEIPMGPGGSKGGGMMHHPKKGK